jgi:plasmid stabilization system protein ParE
VKVVWTRAALADLAEILDYTELNYPSLVGPLESRLARVVSRISARPESARRVATRTSVRVVPLIRFPFRLYYHLGEDRIAILHIHHTSRQAWLE